MLNAIIRTFVNLVYLVPLKVRRFKRDHPRLHVFAAGAVKARRLKADSEPGYEYGWATARRNTLILAADGLHCGDWFIPLSGIQDAELLRITGGLLLKISAADGRFYQFGMQEDPAWESQTVLPLRAERVELKFSLASLVVRLIALAFVTWRIFLDFTAQRFNVVTVVYLLLFVWIVVPIIRLLLSKLNQQ